MATREEAKLAKARKAILKKALENVAFDGFVPKSIDDAATTLKIAPELAKLAFPDGPSDLLRMWSEGLDDDVRSKLEKMDLTELKIRQRVATGVKLRIEAMAANKIAARRAAAFLAIPVHVPLGAQLTFRTADAIWRGIGDTATDFNYYTKRGLLAGVITSTLLFWFSDESEDHAETWAFLDRRIENVMQVEKAKAGLKEFAAKLPDPFKFLGGLRYPASGK